MSELILSAVIIALLGEIIYLTKSHRAEVDKLTRAVIAKNLTSLDTSTIIESDKSKPVKEVEPDVIPLEQADDKLFDEAIRQ